MAQKTYSLYNSATIEGEQKLALEIGKSYVALVLGAPGNPVGFEYYDSEDDNHHELLSYIKQHSRLLDKSYSETRLYFNLEETVLVPVGQFNTSIAAEFVELAFGPKYSSRINVENVNVQPGIVNVYRSEEDWQQLLGQYFRAVTKRHLLSRLIEHAAPGSLKVQCYKTEMIVVATKNNQLQLARNFEAAADEDIVYHLLNSCKQTDIDPVNTTIIVSGFIDEDSKALQLLRKYFGKVKLDTPAADIFPGVLSEYPLHYFTSFFNLLS